MWEVTWEGTPGQVWAAMHLRLSDEPCPKEKGHGNAEGWVSFGKGGLLWGRPLLSKAQHVGPVPGGHGVASYR